MKKNLIKTVFYGLLLIVSQLSLGQVTDTELLTKQWKAQWIPVPGTNPTGYGVYYFRKNLDLTVVPKTFPIYVSADNRYKLFVNEKLVSLGPARGDIQHWNYETVDLAPFLQAGKNIIAAQVWNEGKLRTEGHISLRTAFILQGATDEAQVFNTNESWKCFQDKGYKPIHILMQTYYVGGPGERMDMEKHCNGWETLSFHDKDWTNASPIAAGSPKFIMGFYGNVTGWMLVSSSLPQMELTPQRLQKTLWAEGIRVPANFPAEKASITIQPNTTAKLLLDQSFLTNAYPTMIFSGGIGGVISVGYQEALFTKYPEKGNRNEVNGKMMIGRVDSIISDGTSNQRFTTLNWRTYRYIQLNITTKDAPLELEDIYGTLTGYPVHLNAKLETDNAEMKKMLETGWRTARLCAMETYMDCPYYEQLQYIGDTRIQAMVTLYNSGDDRLVRNALNLMSYSQQPEGVTASRHPSVTTQYISTFSLWYVAMLHDYMMYGNDANFVRTKLQSTRNVLEFFERYQREDGSLKNVPYWTFVDWVYTKGWIEGIPPMGADGSSSILDMQLLLTYQAACDLEQKFGNKELALEYSHRTDQLKKTIQSKYWDEKRQLFADRPEKDFFSQHANTFAILTGLVNQEQAHAIATKLLTDATLAPASIYFKYYLHQALTKAGLGNDYLKWLDKWRENLSYGLTTWAETSDVNSTRSDCHAWGASPNIEFFRIILGIDSDAPGFSKVKIEPHLGEIKTIGGEIPHSKGKIKVNYVVTDGHLQAVIELPSEITGHFVWKGKSYDIKPGKNSFNI